MTENKKLAVTPWNIACALAGGKGLRRRAEGNFGLPLGTLDEVFQQPRLVRNEDIFSDDDWRRKNKRR
ncbi:MAG: hypothetical protein PHF35_03460 [Candidatus Moranbacteria bacterium]|nr:hypothetical protein [Candidatus Moranbacteria bacterium]